MRAIQFGAAAAVIAGAFALAGNSAHALSIAGEGINGYASFTGTIDYNAVAKRLDLSLTSTMTNPPFAVGYITGVVLNNPGDNQHNQLHDERLRFSTAWTEQLHPACPR
jgi:hypothetical protein